ncbi:MAG: hypothetical protein MZV70_31635 [Desulfobacterales bacterium]|nr:hypothetical protein [Desulfobacterales bacterium]
MWLVPSEPIREQTLKALRDKTTILCRSVATALGDFTVLEIDEAIRVTPHVLNGSNAIIVATMQAFKQEDTGRLSVYKENGYLMEHFDDAASEAATRQWITGGCVAAASSLCHCR